MGGLRGAKRTRGPRGHEAGAPESHSSRPDHAGDGRLRICRRSAAASGVAVDSHRRVERAGPHQRGSKAAEWQRRDCPAKTRRCPRVHSRTGARPARRQQRSTRGQRSTGGFLPMTTILIVEDNEMNRDMLSRRLKRRGYEVLVAVDGEMGIELARTQSPHLILMDMSLPLIDGWEATRRLKADPELKHIP